MTDMPLTLLTVRTAPPGVTAPEMPGPMIWAPEIMTVTMPAAGQFPMATTVHEPS